MKPTVLSEIQNIKLILGKLLDLSDLATDSKFSMEKVESAAMSFLKFQTERGQWIAEDKLEKYFKGCWNAGRFIREHFGFNDWIKYSYSYLYNKKSIERLADELKKRNVDLQRYIEYIESRAAFEKKMDEFSKKRKGKYGYLLSDDLSDIQTTEMPKPDLKLIRNDISKLKSKFSEFKMSDYIDIYKGHYAVMKTDFAYDKYRDSDLIARCKKWCYDFTLLNFPFLRLPSLRCCASICSSSSSSRAVSRNSFNRCANAPSLPNNDVPVLNCDKAFSLMRRNQILLCSS